MCKDGTIRAERDQILCHPPLSASLILTFSGNTQNFNWLFCNNNKTKQNKTKKRMYLIALTKVIVLSHYKGMAILNVTTSELLGALLVIRWTEGVSNSLLWNRFKL